MILYSNTLLFFDPVITNESQNIEFIVCQPVDRRVILEPDRPWESRFIAFYTSVVKDDGRYRMFYTCRDNTGMGSLALAESDDGLSWRKPSLGVTEYQGSKNNNLLGIDSLEGTVLFEPDAPSEERYKYFAHHYRKGFLLHTSPDGIRWKTQPGVLMSFFCDTQNVVFYDKLIGRYVFYLRGYEERPGSMWKTPMRTVVRGETDDLSRPIPFTAAEHARKRGSQQMIYGEFERVLACDELDGADTDVYTMAAEPYPEAPNYYIAFPALYRHDPPVKHGGRYDNDGDIETSFAGSIDGKLWHRYDRRPYIRNDPVGRFRCRMAFMGPGVFTEEGVLRQYGTIYRTRHGETSKRDEQPDGKLVCYEQRLDGFMCAELAKEGGFFTSCPWVCQGRGLLINVDCGMHGWVRVGLENLDGRVINGYATSDCNIVCTNETSAEVCWKGGTLTKFSGKQIRVRVEGASSRIFALRMV